MKRSNVRKHEEVVVKSSPGAASSGRQPSQTLACRSKTQSREARTDPVQPADASPPTPWGRVIGALGWRPDKHNYKDLRTPPAPRFFTRPKERQEGATTTPLHGSTIVKVPPEKPKGEVPKAFVGTEKGSRPALKSPPPAKVLPAKAKGDPKATFKGSPETLGPPKIGWFTTNEAGSEASPCGHCA